MPKPRELCLRSQTKKGQTDIFVQADLFFFPPGKQNKIMESFARVRSSGCSWFPTIKQEGRAGHGSGCPHSVSFWGLLCVPGHIHSFIGGIQLSCLWANLSFSPKAQEKLGPVLRKSLQCPRASLGCFSRWHLSLGAIGGQARW